MPERKSERGHYLPTGMRIVGRAAEELMHRAKAEQIEQMRPGMATDTLYAVQFTLEPRVQGRPAVEHLLDALTDDVRTSWAECPRLLRDQEESHPPTRFSGMRFRIDAEPGKQWLGEIVWRAVHPFVPGSPVTTRVLIEERASFTRVSVRVTADNGIETVRGAVGAGQAQPAFIRALRREGMTPSWLGGILGARRVHSGEVQDLVASVLADSERSTPVVVLAPFEEGGYVIPPDDLAWELLGRARLCVLQEHRQSFELTDAVGDRQMSCYWGAARAYMPSWSRHDDPADHPLLLSDRLEDPVIRAAWLGRLGIWLGTRLELPEPFPEPRAAGAPPEREEHTEPAAGLKDSGTAGTIARLDDGEEEHESPAEFSVAEVEPAASNDEAAGRAEAPPAAAPSPLTELLISEVRGLAGLVSRMADEVERLRTISSVRSSSTNAIERRLARLEEILEEAFPDGRASTRAAPATSGDEDRAVRDAEPGQSLFETVHAAAASYPEALDFLDSAYASAKESPYEDPERVRAIFEAMARTALRRRDGLLGTSLREAFADLGIDYRGAIARTTPARLREQYRFARNGELIEAEEHIVLGNTYDPRRCLRIYFSSRVVNDARFIIAHVGRHFEVITST